MFGVSRSQQAVGAGGRKGSRSRSWKRHGHEEKDAEAQAWQEGEQEGEEAIYERIGDDIAEHSPQGTCKNRAYNSECIVNVMKCLRRRDLKLCKYGSILKHMQNYTQPNATTCVKMSEHIWRESTSTCVFQGVLVSLGSSAGFFPSLAIRRESGR